MSLCLLPIREASDPRVADYFHVQDGEWIKRRGRFLAEGHEVLATLIERGRYPVDSVLLAENKVERLTPLLERLPAEVPIYVASMALLEGIVGFPLHRGVLAVGRIGAPLSVEAAVAALPAGPALVLGLEGLSNTDNVGALFRNGAAFGVNLLLLDPGSADPLYRKAIRTSMGHALVLPFARTPPWPAGLEVLRAAGFVTYALTPRAEATSVIELFRGGLPREERVALLVGAEGPGLSAATLAAVDRGLRIPMSAGVDSLNVATAAALGLFALRAR